MEPLPQASRSDQTEILPWQPRWKNQFAALNRAWLQERFSLEPYDEEVLNDPEGRILAGGGEVLFACLGEEVLGTCALLHHGDGTWETLKLAVVPEAQGRGLGRRLLVHCLEVARQRGAPQVFARTSPMLGASNHLLKELGFEFQGPDTSHHYQRPSTVYRLRL